MTQHSDFINLNLSLHVCCIMASPVSKIKCIINNIDLYNCYESLKFLLFVPSLARSFSVTLFNLLCTYLSCYKCLFDCMTLSSYLCSSLCIARLFVCAKIVLAEVLLILLLSTCHGQVIADA